MDDFSFFQDVTVSQQRFTYGVLLVPRRDVYTQAWSSGKDTMHAITCLSSCEVVKVLYEFRSSLLCDFWDSAYPKINLVSMIVPYCSILSLRYHV